ncbi:SDR family oxidoreductase [[Bacillus] enclensis]|uniref:SDR family oxidoreductase n=1 Tax=[Bacillus] enclensis TaxID=1402860 RepID=UPI0018DD29AA|nr:NmrA family NAD(P)-binding protein [[Bacillus] enclensis]MBH9967904.1 NmrA family NAD(P)-binding protein [[Bacillus] enclensis]
MLLVTGITGHSGKFFLQELIRNKYYGPIRCIVRANSDTSLIDNSGLDIEKIVGDLENQEFMNEVMSGVNTVVHIASIFYSATLMRAAVKNDVKRAILVHTTGIYSKYKSASEEYKGIEKSIDKIIKESNSTIGLIYLRPTMIYGYINDSNMIVFIKMVDRLRLFPIIDQGRNLLQPVNGRDLGKAYYQVLRKSNIMSGDYILSGESPISMKELFRLISQILGKNTTFISIPLVLGVFMAKCLKVCTLGKVDYIERVQRMGEDRSFSHKSATEDFDYQPMSLSEGLKIEIEEYLKKVQ